MSEADNTCNDAWIVWYGTLRNIGAAGFREGIVLVAGVTNVIERPFFLPRIAVESLTTVDPDETTMVVNETLDAALEVPPHTAKDAAGNDFTGQLSISEVPDALAPAALPETLSPGLLITIQPVGATFAQPVALTLPNVDELPAGSELDLWSLDPNAGRFVIVGTGVVSQDGTVIETTTGGVRAADWHAFLPPPPDNDERKPPNAPENDCRQNVASETTLCTGELMIEHALASYRSLDQPRGLSLVYRSLSADPRPIARADSAVSVRAAVPVPHPNPDLR